MSVISSTGIGSGLNVSGIISQLMTVESQPLTTMQQQVSSYQTSLSAFGSLNSALSALQSSVTSLSSSATFTTLGANSSNTAVSTVTAGASATAGTYNLNVSQMAQAQTISSAGQVSSTAAIGSGTASTITIQFGSVTGTATSGTFSNATFTSDPTQSIGTIKIDSSNNSLQGIASAINTANVGVTASIVGDGSATPYHLVLTSAKTGSNSSMQISVSGDSALQNLLNYDPSGTQNFTQITAAQNASLTVNGIAISSQSNAVSKSIQGLTFNLTGTGTSTVTVSNNTGAVTNAINSFVTSYNSLNSTMSQLTAYNSTTKVAGPLLGDPTIRTLQNQMRNIFNTSVSGSSGNITSLAQIGVTFKSDGSLTVNSTQLQSALSNNFSAVGSMLSSIGSSSDPLVTYVGAGSSTQAGSYPLNVTALATQGSLTGNTSLSGGNVTIASNTSINVTVDGNSSTVNLTAGSYSASQLAQVVQSAINTNSTMSTNGAAVSASIDSNGYLKLTSNSYGKTSNISVSSNTGTDVASLFGTSISGTAGTDVSGTINGTAAVGAGQYLTGAVGTPVSGLQVQVPGGSTGNRGNINYSQGVAYQLGNLLTSYLNTSTGVLQNTTKNLNTQIKNVQAKITSFSTNLAQIQANYQAQFSALDTMISKLNGTQSYLTQQINVLNGTANSK